MCAYICLCCSYLDPMDCSSPGFPVHRISQARILVPFPSPGNLHDPAIEPVSPAWQTDTLPLSHLGSSYLFMHIYKYI